jgi:hypothetical protein
MAKRELRRQLLTDKAVKSIESRACRLRRISAEPYYGDRAQMRKQCDKTNRSTGGFGVAKWHFPGPGKISGYGVANET